MRYSWWKISFFLPIFLIITVQANKAIIHSQITQISTFPALLKGIYDGAANFKQIAKVGDFGIGTFEGIDGEMVALDGHFYQITGDGVVHDVADTLETPFATVHFFQSDKEITLDESIIDYPALQNYLNRYLISQNQPLSFKIQATFDYVKTRSVSKQSKPYPPLTDVAAKQAVFEFNQPITGTLVGYWLPSYLDKLNIVGYHFHFLSEDKQKGGHLLDCRLTKATIKIDYIDSIVLLIPQNEAFQKADLQDYSKKDVDKIEKYQK